MRKQEDKKGGLMFMYKSGCDFVCNSTDTKISDLIELRGRIKCLDIRIILMYLSVERTQEDKTRNKTIQNEILKKIQENQDTEKEALILLGDMNGHTG